MVHHNTPTNGCKPGKFSGGESNCSNEIAELELHKYSVKSLLCKIIQYSVV